MRTHSAEALTQPVLVVGTTGKSVEVVLHVELPLRARVRRGPRRLTSSSIHSPGTPCVLDGRNAHLADGVQRVLGREPTDFAYYARRTASTGVWQVVAAA